MNVLTAAFLLNLTKNLVSVLVFLLAFFVESGRGYFIVAAVLIFLLGGVSAKQQPDICPECGALISDQAVKHGEGV